MQDARRQCEDVLACETAFAWDACRLTYQGRRIRVSAFQDLIELDLSGYPWS